MLSREEKLAQHREHQRRYQRTPEARAKRAAARAKWVAENYDHAMAYSRAWKKNKYHSDPQYRTKDKARRDRLRAENREHYLAYNRAYDALRRARRTRDRVAIIGEALQQALGKNTLYAAALAAVPANFPRHTREDIVSSLVLAVLEGEISETEIASHAKAHISAHYRMFTKYGPGGSIMRSLDQPVYHDNPTPLIETVSEGLWS